MPVTRKLQPQTAQLTLVLDAGSNSKQNLKDLPTSYVVVLRPSDQKKWLAEIAPLLEEIPLSSGEVVRAYRQRRTVLDEEREVVAVFSPSLHQGQLRGLRQQLDKAGLKLQKIGTWSRYQPVTLEKRLQRILDHAYLKHLIRYELHPDPVRGTRLRFWSDLKEYRRLENAYFGLRVLASDRQDWSTAEIIEAHRSQPRAESCFRDLKNPTMIATRPQFHWTDQKLRVHAFICVMAYLLVRLLWWRYQRSAADCPSPARLLAQLKRVRLARIVELSGKPGRPRSYLKIEQMDASLQRLARLTRALPQI
jgi:transposase